MILQLITRNNVGVIDKLGVEKFQQCNHNILRFELLMRGHTKTSSKKKGNVKWLKNLSGTSNVCVGNQKWRNGKWLRQARAGSHEESFQLSRQNSAWIRRDKDVGGKIKIQRVCEVRAELECIQWSLICLHFVKKPDVHAMAHFVMHLFMCLLKCEPAYTAISEGTSSFGAIHICQSRMPGSSANFVQGLFY